MAFIPTPIEEIRSSTLDFKQFVLRCMDRMDMVLPACVQSGSYKVIDAKVRLIYAAASFYYSDDPEFKKEMAAIETKIDSTQSWDYQNYKELMKLVALLSNKKFQRMEVLPPLPGTIWMGREHYERPQPKEAAAHI